MKNHTKFLSNKTTSSSKEYDSSENNNFFNKYNTGRWSKNEHFLFLHGCLLYGNDWTKVQKLILMRSNEQIRSHSQKFIMKASNKYSDNLKKFLSANEKSAHEIISLNRAFYIKHFEKCIEKSVEYIEFLVLAIFNLFSDREYKHLPSKNNSNSEEVSLSPKLVPNEVLKLEIQEKIKIILEEYLRGQEELNKKYIGILKRYLNVVNYSASNNNNNEESNNVFSIQFPITNNDVNYDNI